jgi:hypothetical protein
LTSGLEHLRVNKDVVAADIGMVRRDVSDASHIGGEVVQLIDTTACREQAIVSLAQVEDLELIGRASLVLGMLEIHATNPVALPLQPIYKVVTDKTTCTRYEYPLSCVHVLNSFPKSYLTRIEMFQRENWTGRANFFS